MTENDLYEQVERYIRIKYPSLPHHWDLSGMWTPSHKARNLYGRLNKRAWPDLLITVPVMTKVDGVNEPIYFHGCFIELKKEGTRLKKRDDTWATEHIAEQAAVLESLCELGYIAQFAVGFDKAKQRIDSYMAGL